MNVLAINGSPHGGKGNTGRMLEALLEGFRLEGANTTSVELTDMTIAPCRACHSCWFRTPGSCVQKDGMEDIIQRMRVSDILIFGTPVHFCNVSGQLKVFFDRLTAAGGDPHKAAGTEGKPPPGYILVANCGFPAREQFDVLSLWMRQVARMTKATVLAEFFATRGKVLTAPEPEEAAARDRYLEFLKECAAGLCRNGALDSLQATRLGKEILEF